MILAGMEKPNEVIGRASLALPFSSSARRCDWEKGNEMLECRAAPVRRGNVLSFLEERTLQ